MKVSIIIPYLEDRGYLGQAVDSASNQNGFVIGVDYEIILQQGNYRLGKNINDGVRKAKGKYIKFLADDDLLTPNCLIDLYTKAEQGYDFVCADSIDFTEDGTETICRSIVPSNLSELASKNSIHGGTILYRKSSMPEWDEKMWTAEEYEMTLRMAKIGLRFGYTPSVVTRYRIHSASKSQAHWNVDEQTGIYRFEYIENLQMSYMINQNIII